MTVKIIDQIQNTDAWLAWRQNRIGGSDASIILYESPYKSPYTLWQEKIGRRKPEKAEDEDRTPFGKSAKKHGKDTEDEARDVFTEETGIPMSPACLENDAVPGLPMSASLDGYNRDDDATLEVKCPKTLYDFIEVREGRIPDQYYPQVMHNWYVAQTKWFYFYAYFKDPDGKAHSALIQLGPKQLDPDYVVGVLIPEEQKFWKRVVEKSWPAPKGERDASDDPNLCECAKYWAQAQLELRKWEKQARRYRAGLLREMNGLKRLTANGVQVTASTRKGFVMWKQAMADLGVSFDEEKYRAPESMIYELIQVKE